MGFPLSQCSFTFSLLTSSESNSVCTFQLLRYCSIFCSHTAQLCLVLRGTGAAVHFTIAFVSSSPASTVQHSLHNYWCWQHQRHVALVHDISDLMYFGDKQIHGTAVAGNSFGFITRAINGTLHLKFLQQRLCVLSSYSCKIIATATGFQSALLLLVWRVQLEKCINDISGTNHLS